MNWILNNKGVAVSYGGDSFPLAFRTAFNMVRTAREAGKDASALVRDLTITAPPHPSFPHNREPGMVQHLAKIWYDAKSRKRAEAASTISMR